MRRRTHPALPIGRRDARAFSVREHAATSRPIYPLQPPTFLIRGAARKQPPGCFVLSEALVVVSFSSLFPFVAERQLTSRRPRRSAGRDVVLLPAGESRKKDPCHPIPPFDGERADTRTHSRVSTHMHTRVSERVIAPVQPRMLRASFAFVTFYYWQSARSNRACSPDRASRRQPADAPNSDVPS